MPACGTGYLPWCTQRGGMGPSILSLTMSGANSGFVILHLIEGDNLAGVGGQSAVRTQGSVMPGFNAILL